MSPKFGRIIYPKPIVKSIAPVIENFPGVAEGDRSLVVTEYAAQTSPAVAEGDRLLVVTEDAAQTSPGVEVDSAKIRNDNYLDCPRCGTVRGLYATCPGLESVWETRCIHCDYLEPSIRHPFEDVRPFEVDRVQKSLIKSKFGRIIYPKPIVKPIAPVVENSPGVAEGDRSLSLVSLVEHAAQNSPGVAEGDRFLPLVEYAAQNSPGVAEGDRLLVVTEDAAQTSPGVEVEQVQESIEVDQVQEPPSSPSLAASFIPNRLLSRSHKMQKLDPNSTEQKVLMYITGALIPPTQFEIAAALKLKHWEARKAIGYWRCRGIVTQFEGEFYPVSQLNWRDIQ